MARRLLEYLEKFVAFARLDSSRAGLKYSCIEEFILRNGQIFTPQPFPKKYKRGRIRQCFCNAYNLALDNQLIYVEGFALSVVPLLHAWCVVPGTNVVIDPTWRQKGHEYFGVPLKFDYVLQSIIRYECYGIIDNGIGTFPILFEDDDSVWRLTDGDRSEHQKAQ